MIQSGFFYWYGPEVSMEDNEITEKQYNDFITKGLYKERKDY